MAHQVSGYFDRDQTLLGEEPLLCLAAIGDQEIRPDSSYGLGFAGPRITTREDPPIIGNLLLQWSKKHRQDPMPALNGRIRND